MTENSAIEWTDHTFNPWMGCQEVSPGCDHCYARTLMAERYRRVAWGPGANRQRTSASYWKQPLRWDRKAAAAGARARVFCASLADVFDNAVPDQWRVDLWELIRQTPHLDWMLLTKRPQNVAYMLPTDYIEGGPIHDNIWLGVSVENQEEAERRIPKLERISPTYPPRLRFLSCEPLLGPLDLSPWITLEVIDHFVRPSFDLVIVGGESGANRRPMDLAWAREIRRQCRVARIPFFMKQVDKREPIPDDLMIRQFPIWTPYGKDAA